MSERLSSHPKLEGFSLEFDPGWDQIVLDLARELDEIDPEWQPVQIKEKFGGLRCYLDSGNMSDDVYDAVSDAVERAERRASRTCEICGSPGELRNGGWMKTLCDEHARKR